MKVRFTFAVTLVDDNNNDGSGWMSTWFANYDPTENYDGLQKELAEFVKDGLVELEQIQK